MRWLSWAFIVGGILLGSSFVVSSPHAFGLGWYAVIGGAVAGLTLILCGSSILRQVNATRPDALDPSSPQNPAPQNPPAQDETK